MHTNVGFFFRYAEDPNMFTTWRNHRQKAQEMEVLERSTEILLKEKMMDPTVVMKTIWKAEKLIATRSDEIRKR